MDRWTLSLLVVLGGAVGGGAVTLRGVERAHVSVLVAGPGDVAPFDGPGPTENTKVLTVLSSANKHVVFSPTSAMLFARCVNESSGVPLYIVNATDANTSNGVGPYCDSCTAGPVLPTLGDAYLRTSSGTASVGCTFNESWPSGAPPQSSGASGLSQASADARYLKLDVSNDPLTDSLEVLRSQNAATAIDVVNATNGTAATAQIKASNDPAGAEYLAFGYGAANNTAPEFADRGFITSGTGASGLTINAGAGDVRWTTGSPPTSTERMRLTTTGLSIGTAANATEKLDVFDATLSRLLSRSDLDAQLLLESGGGHSSGVVQYSHRGTIASPTAIQSADVEGSLYFGGYTGTANSARAHIDGVATENWSDSAKGTKLTLATVPNGTQVASTALTLDQNGQALFTAGAVGAPSISIAGDNDTGMYEISANNLGFATNGTLGLAVSSSQNVAFLGILGGGLLINNPPVADAVNNYNLMRETTAITGTDCDAAGETGRYVWDSVLHQLNVCEGAGGWKIATFEARDEETGLLHELLVEVRHEPVASGAAIVALVAMLLSVRNARRLA